VTDWPPVEHEVPDESAGSAELLGVFPHIMSMGQSMNTWHAMRSFTQDRDVTRKKLAPGTLRRIVRFASPYRGAITVLLVMLAVDAGIGVLNPLLFRAIIDVGIPKHRSGLVVGIAVIVAIVAVADAVLSLVERFYSSKIGEGLIFDMRARVFSHIQRMPIAFFTRTQTGALISRLNNDILGAQQAFTGTLSSVVSNVLGVSFTLTVMFILSWQITLVALAMLPVFVLPARYFGRRLQAITRESYNLNAAMNVTMTERFNVSGAMLVKLFGRPQAETDEFARKAGRVRDIGVTQSMYGGVFFASLMLVAALATALVYGWGGWLAVRGQLPIGTVVALAAYLTRLYGPLTALSNVNVTVMTALVSFERVFEVLDLPPMIDDAPDAVALPPGAGTVEFDHVDFRYPSASEVSLASLESVAVLDPSTNVQVLHDLSFTADAGQLIALVGPSGAGKTTISALVSRLYDVTGGSVRIGGVDVRQATQESLRDTVGVVTQDSHMFHDTVRANLAYARPEATEAELIEALKSAQIWELVSSLADGLDTIVGERGYRLSGGEKQRLAIARLLLKAPSIVVLDEATAHLDSESELAVQRALKTALAGRTSLVIAHRLSTIREADQILVIEDGRIAERGQHDELLAAGGLYAELYHTQFERQDLEQPTV
jgi:ATP-binding cassette subfamily B protein